MAAEAYDGLLVLDKPGGPTSRDLVNRVQKWFPRGTKVGHAGTLDPLATGVLVVAVGRATRLTEYVQRMGKTYRTQLRLGCRSDTDDADGTVTPVPGAAEPPVERVDEVLRRFVGVIGQVPPAFSAAKVTGERAYDLARRGEDVSLSARPVRIDRVERLAYGYPLLELEIDCGKGTYVRSIARDLGEALGCGAYVQTLRRTRIGPFGAGEAVPLDLPAGEARRRLLPLAAAVSELPALRLPGRDVERLRSGQAVAVDPAALPEVGEVAVIDPADRLALIAEVIPGGRLKPAKVLT
jgi:tRNA pseudouridine55 synthase